MDPISLPDNVLEGMRQTVPTARRQVIGPPNGDLLNGNIRAIDVVSSYDEETGPRIHTFWKPTEEELAIINRGGIIEFTWIGDHLHPISALVWGA